MLDLADRIRKRRRAQELIDHAKVLAAQQVTDRGSAMARRESARTAVISM